MPARILTLALLLGMSLSARSAQWSQLPPIPDAEGFAGAFTGVSGGALIVAGGANITGDKWAEPLHKTWYDSAFVLAQPDGQWQSGLRLPRALAYGISITVDDSVVCIGGSNNDGHSAEVFRLRWHEGKLESTPLPPLPKPCANACGALLGRTIYVAGGIETPTATAALKTFWSLNLDDPQPSWRALDPWPGSERMLSVAGVHDGAFFLFSGTSLAPDAEGKPVRTFLRDAYRFHPGEGWQRLADLPRAAVAAPSPAIPRGAELLVLTGDDGLNVQFQPVKDHPGFPRDLLAYNTRTNTWRAGEPVPFSRATVPTVEWNGRFVIPNGEARPRVRTPEVWTVMP